MIRVAFCQHFFYENLGIMMLSAQLKLRGHQVEVFVNDLRSLYKAIELDKFDLICFSIMTSDVSWALSNAKKIKNNNNSIPIAAGGPHTTFFPEFIELNREFDIICVGEGDQAIVELAESLDHQTAYTHINNLTVRDQDNSIIKNPLNPLIQDLDSLPFADRELYIKYMYYRKLPITSMVVSRGCPYKCSFCFNHQYNELYGTSRFRLRSPENIIEEIKAIQKHKDINLLLFVDSTFNLNAKWCEEFFKKYKEELNVKFSLNFTAGAMNEKILDALCDTGNCHTVRFGVEVGNEKHRMEVLGKPVSNSKILRAATLLRERDIPIYIFIMFGVPFETEQTAIETIKLAQLIKPSFINSALFSPYRGLDVTKLALENNFITENDIKKLDNPQFSRMDSVMHLKDINAIRNIFYFSLAMIHFPFTERFLMKIIHMKCNRLFKCFLLLSHFFQTRGFVKIGWLRSIVEGFHHRSEV